MGELTIAFCGLGRMGRAMAENLVAAGFTVRAWNRTPGKTPKGAVECLTPKEAAQGARFAVTMLADDAAVSQTVFGDEGLMAGLPEGALHAGMSTVSVALSQRLAEAHRKAGQRFVAAPVFGRPDAAAARKLWIIAGGDAADVEACKPLFAAIGQGTYPMGTAPQASLAKLCGNFMLVGLIEMFGEAFALADKAGIDSSRLGDALISILFANAPAPKGYAARIAATEFEPAGFAMPLGFKDVSLVLEAGRDLRVPLPLASIARDHFLASLARGRDGWDWGGMAAVLRENAGLPPTKP